ncbi:hypothetical protein TNCV_5138111 [Trichonephila clavipes]|nr:hypothetical protein TNCV_5138111 [Trichonephila clavipes]
MLTNPNAVSSIRIGDLDTEQRKTHPSRSCHGAIYPTIEQPKRRQTRTTQQSKPSVLHHAAKTSSPIHMK